MASRHDTRGKRNIGWIEKFCLYPRGPERGQRVQLTETQRELVRRIYDHPDGPQQRDVPDPLAAYLASLHTCGREATQRNFRPEITVDIFTIWGASGPDLRAVLKRDGASVRCPELGTRWPIAA